MRWNVILSTMIIQDNFDVKMEKELCVFNSRGQGTLKVDFVQVYNQLSGLCLIHLRIKYEYITLAYYTVEMGISLKTKQFSLF